MKMSRMFSKVFYIMMICMMLVRSSCLVAQNAPVTTIGTVGNAIPGFVEIPVTVTDFTNIGACSLTIEYEYAGLQFVQGVPNPMLSGFAIGDQNMGNGKHHVIMGWFGSGVTLPDESAIMTITFTYISGSTSVNFFETGPSCEYADANYNVLNDVPQSSYYHNGMVCGAIGIPGTIAGNTNLCQGQTGISYSVYPVANATAYEWTVPAGAIIMSGNNTNVISVDYSLAATSGTITVNGLNDCGTGPVSQLPVTVSPLPFADAGPDALIPYGTSTTLHAANGGSGLFNYHWSPEALLVDPNLQNPQTLNLTESTVFTLLVTNQASLCESSDEVSVSITGGPLNANPIAMPDSICRGEAAQLFSNTGGGSGTYTFAWSCIPAGNPPWSSDQANPVVNPDSSTIYQLTISDGFNSVQGSTSLTVFQLPTATISGGDTLCGEGNSTVLTVDLTGTPPWSLYYSNGTTSWFIESLNTTPLVILASESGEYNILSMSDAHCAGTPAGSAVVAIFPVPPAPVISVNGTELFSTGCCGNQWYKEGALIAGATGQFYQPIVSGHYFDIVTVNGCSSDTSNTVYYLMTGIRKSSSSGFSVEPNPATDFIKINAREVSPLAGEIMIFSVTGKQEFFCSMNPLDNKDNVSINIQHLSPGLYFLIIVTKSEKTVMKLIVQ